MPATYPLKMSKYLRRAALEQFPLLSRCRYVDTLGLAVGVICALR